MIVMAGAGAFGRDITLLPKFHAGRHAPVITQTLTTGTVAPQYYHEAELVIFGDGAWEATRRYPYTDPPRQSAIASGTLPLPRVQALVDLAFQGSPRFVDLPSEYPADIHRRPIGGGRRMLSLQLEGGTHAVTAYGAPPASFAGLETAIASETLPLSLR